ncbi:ABC transporter ATP-binding protein [Streptococcus cuniculipharyngis]|uniref:ABC transporter ATP-binding protein n=1 Tax=Streptococcus cuniculipharyngis TaxID=1562651 RepID=A0A5C5SF36_9STRE|nr:ABC transporter ATP-binding protein [Streptococcus cuniculipharyngis]TWS98753.1 ABC transporter ATP-binding protein [Streptococcus cuniculipharyngis]
MTDVIVVKNLSKAFANGKGIKNIDFTIAAGEIFGFLGPSGSGKTTTINILMGLLVADSGQALIFQKSATQFEEADYAKIALVSDHNGMYEKMTLYDNLLFYCRHYGLPQKRLDNLLQRVGLYDSRKTVAEKLSTGMKQRLFLVRALLNTPKVLFLDEPTSGLDPATSRTIHEILLELREQGTAIFLTTHDMHEASLLCDRVALLNQGSLVEVGKPSELVQKYHTNKVVKVSYPDGSEQLVAFDRLADIVNAQEALSIHSCEPTLEDVFIELTGGGLNA